MKGKTSPLEQGSQPWEEHGWQAQHPPSAPTQSVCKESLSHINQAARMGLITLAWL